MIKAILLSCLIGVSTICFAEEIHLLCYFLEDGKRGDPMTFSFVEQNNGKVFIYRSGHNVEVPQQSESIVLKSFKMTSETIEYETLSIFPPRREADPRLDLTEARETRAVSISRVDGSFSQRLVGSGGLFATLTPGRPYVSYGRGRCEKRQQNKF